MILSFWGQGRLFLQLLLLGLSFGMLYDFFRTLRRLLHHAAFFVHFEDGLFWLLVFFSMFLFLLKTNGARLRFFCVAAAFLGMALYFIFFSFLSQKIFYAVGFMTKKWLKALCKFLMTPLYIALKLIVFPIYRVWVKIKRNGKKCLHFLHIYGKIRLKLVCKNNCFLDENPRERQ